MSNILVRFYRNVENNPIIVRTEYCDSFIEADFIVEQETGHYDTVSIIDLNENN
jgi:hypothetical protein